MPGPRKHLHPLFRSKNVMQLHCHYCGNCVCNRGMRAILLSDIAVELYSTDLPPTEGVAPIDEVYKTIKCQCKIKDIACRQCGNPVGYAVIKPCTACLASCNNGHFYMFNSNDVDCMDRLDKTGTTQLLWGTLEELEEEDGNVRDGGTAEECIR